MFSTSVPILCYHNVSEVDGHTPALFAEHLDAITDAGFKTVTATEVLHFVQGKGKLPSKPVLLTFDDGHVSNWTHAVPLLNERNMTGTFFGLSDFTVPGEVRSGNVEHMTAPDSFRTALSIQNYSQFINESEFRAMLDQGHEVFSHGCRHQGCFRNLRPEWPSYSDNAHWSAWGIYPRRDERWPVFTPGSAYVYNGFWPQFPEGADMPQFKLRTEAERRAFCLGDMKKSLDYFRQLNGKQDQLFCYPWGQFDALTEEVLREVGYAGAFTLERSANARGTNPFRLHRLGVGKKKTGAWVQQRLRMYCKSTPARIFFKYLRKKSEISSVLYATDSLKLSGGSRQLVNNIEAMTAMGVRTTAVLHPDSEIIPALDKLDVEVIRFDKFKKYLHAAKFLKKLVKERNIEVVHSFHNRAYKMGVLAKLLGAKFKLFINRGVISRPNDVFFLWTALADGVVCNSLKCSDVLKKHKVIPKRLNVVYNAYCGPDFGEPVRRKKRGVRILYIGNEASTKGFDVFLKAADIYRKKDARDVEFIGAGIRNMDPFEALLTPELENRLGLPGHLSHAEVIEEIRASDMLVVPSRMESLPNTMLEAYDHGLPVVCTKAGGIPELVRNGHNGYLCEIEDAECLAEHMRELADDAEKRWQMGNINRKIVRTLLTREAKGRNLMRVYMGERLHDPLPVEDIIGT